jgi:uncharacterized protein
MNLVTPGVYVEELTASPNAVAQVAAAVPAFIGHTETAIDGDGGVLLINQPVRIGSMSEFERHFGGPPQPSFTLTAKAAGAVVAGPLDLSSARGQQAVFTFDGQDCLLSRAPGKAGGRFLMHQSLRHFFQNGGEVCFIVSVGSYNEEVVAGDEDTGLVGGTAALLNEGEPTLVVVPDAVLLSRADCAMVQAAMLEHCGSFVGNRFAILDIWGGDGDARYAQSNCIDDFRQDVGINHLGFSAAYFPWLHTSLVQAHQLDFNVIENRADLASLIRGELKLDEAPASDIRAASIREWLVELGLDEVGWKANLIASNAQSAQTDAEKAAAVLALNEPGVLGQAIAWRSRQLHRSLLAESPGYQAAMDEACALINLMPPSPAMAGVYSRIDNTRGVWRAPANVSLSGVIEPAVDISTVDQQGLNVHTSGKSINAIRRFAGKGVLVWGARTLDGNNPEWRFIHVRRTLGMIEDVCRRAAQSLAFEPNGPQTWARLKWMIDNDLNGFWRAGALAGSKPEHAFFVRVGLGETMTAADILDGNLRCTVGVAITRPAEFIVFNLQQKMQAL